MSAYVIEFPGHHTGTVLPHWRPLSPILYRPSWRKPLGLLQIKFTTEPAAYRAAIYDVRNRAQPVSSFPVNQCIVPSPEREWHSPWIPDNPCGRSPCASGQCFHCVPLEAIHLFRSKPSAESGALSSSRNEPTLAIDALLLILLPGRGSAFWFLVY